MLDAALSYLGRGWSVVPGHTARNDGLCSCNQPLCTSIGKHPRVKWLEFQDRLPTEREVTFWWRRWPDSNVIIITGRLSGIVVVDIDPRHGGDEAWKRWVTEHPVTRTVTSLTGGGGSHLFFLHPGQEVANAVNMLSPGRDPETKKPIESGVDFRGDGGYVVAPPSRHGSGRNYEWDATAHPDDMPISPMPTALIMLVLGTVRAGRGGLRAGLDIDAYVTREEPIADGERNTTMAQITGYFARVVGTPEELSILCDDINQRCCKPPLPQRELRTIERSIWRAETAKRLAQQGVEDASQIDLGEDSTALERATAIWMTLGVKQVTDWLLLSGEHEEYVLVTPEDEIRIPDLLNNDSLRRILLNRTGALIPLVRRGGFDDYARLLRSYAREVIVEPKLAEERLAEWIGAYAARHGYRDVSEEEREKALDQGPLTIDGIRYIRINRFVSFIRTQFGEDIKLTELRNMLKRAHWEAYPQLHAWREGLTDMEKAGERLRQEA